MSRNIKSEEALSAFAIAYEMLKTSLRMMNDLDNAMEPTLHQEIVTLKKELVGSKLQEEISIRQRYLELIENKVKERRSREI